MSPRAPLTPGDPLALFHAATRAWFAEAFAAPTPVQLEGWRRIAAGEHALLLAPTGSGKTLAAFLWCIDRLARATAAPAGVRALYVSPLKALAYDVERNLRVPLAGIRAAAERLGAPLRPIEVAVRTGDTPASERRRLLREPGEILITTPESLYLLLGTAARETLRTVETVIVDEIHALAPSKRGVHLALSLERLVELTGREPQRIGLSATQRPLDEIARFLGGARPVAIVDASERPRLELTIEVPVEDMEAPSAPSAGAQPDARRPADGDRGIWPAIHPRILELIRAHRSTIVFTNSRRLCERLAQRLNELAGEPLVRAHHGSIARAQREEIEQQLKAGALRGIVATSSLELGIDMGAVDLVVQVESPGGVSRGLQRIGRAGHSVGERSIGVVFPKHRADLLEAAVVARRMLDGEVEAIRVPRATLDVLAQQLVAMCSVEDFTVERLETVVKRAYSFSDLSRELLVAVLDMLSGRFPSDAFADLRPRLVWDRARDVVSARKDARLLALVNGGTIPDRGLYGVYLGEHGPRVGELDEEMVHETRAGETFLLGASTWRVVEITRDRVIVKPAPGEPGKMPFWRGEGPGRPLELGRALGAFTRALGEKGEPEACAWLARDYRLDERAARNLKRYVDRQRAVSGGVPSDRAIFIERFRDELGDWRVCILSPFGARVHAPWALALQGRLGRAAGFELQALWSDDGIALRFADSDAVPGAAELVPDPDELSELVLGELSRSALFATHFRENAARALLLPRRRPGARTPLWSQRLRAQSLMAVASSHPRFPIVLETYRECLQDVFDVPALIELLRAIGRGEVEVREVETEGPSPFARSLAFEWVATYLYEGDAPLAERKAQALTLDRELLRELLGQEELRDLLDPEVLDEVEAELQSLAQDRHVRSADGLHDLLRRIGDLTESEAAARSEGQATPDEAKTIAIEVANESANEGAKRNANGHANEYANEHVNEHAVTAAWLEQLRASGRAVRVRLAGEDRWIAVEDVARYRDALGVVPPAGVPAAWLEPAPDALASLVARFARTHAPFAAAAPAARWRLAADRLAPVFAAALASGRLLHGELRPGGRGAEYCDVEVLRLLRRRTLARLRNQVAPVEATVLARFLPRWQGVGSTRGGLHRLREIVAQLEGAALPFSELERAILPARMAEFQPRLLDELGAAGEVVWIGRGALGSDDGRVALYRRDRVSLLADPPVEESPSPLAAAVLGALAARGASFFSAVVQAAGGAREEEVLAALWELVWAGLVTNDTFQPLRALAGPRRAGRLRVATQSAGRWSLVSALRGAAPSETEAAHARALALVERYGVVSREAAAAEAVPGGFAAIAPVLRAMEDAGKLRRGYFVEGLSGAQYAHAAAVDRLRAAREPGGDDVVTLAAVDPANSYGALLPWPATGDGDGDGEGRPRRVAGGKLILARGVPVFFVERGGRRLRYFTGAVAGDEPLVAAALAGLRALAAQPRFRRVRIEHINGVPALRSEHATLLERAGFRVEPGGLVAPGSE